MHRIIISSVHNVAEATLWGFFSVADVKAYDRELQYHFESARLKEGYRMLIDVAGCVIQPQEIIAAFQEHVLSCPKADRIAVVTGSSIIQMQIRRVLTRSDLRIFAERSQAWDWLDVEHVAGALAIPPAPGCG